jgi:hypothetical protein
MLSPDIKYYAPKGFLNFSYQPIASQIFSRFSFSEDHFVNDKVPAHNVRRYLGA